MAWLTNVSGLAETNAVMNLWNTLGNKIAILLLSCFKQ